MNTSAYCGLYCESCFVYITSKKGEQALELLAKQRNTTKEALYCEGCRSDKVSFYCKNCNFIRCADSKNIENCEDCNEYPCSSLKEFQTKMPHRAELFESAKYRKEHGLKKWSDKMIVDYSCKECNNINSAYSLKCMKCGHEPGNDFVERNIELIKSYLKV